MIASSRSSRARIALIELQCQNTIQNRKEKTFGPGNPRGPTRPGCPSFPGIPIDPYRKKKITITVLHQKADRLKKMDRYLKKMRMHTLIPGSPLGPGCPGLPESP